MAAVVVETVTMAAAVTARVRFEKFTVLQFLEKEIFFLSAAAGIRCEVPCVMI